GQTARAGATDAGRAATHPRRGQVTMRYLVPLIWAAAAPAMLQPPAPPEKGKADATPAPRAAPAAPAEKEGVVPKVRPALMMCAHPGDAAHAKTFTETVRKLGEGLTKTVGIPPERQHVLFGADPPKDLPGATGPATREAVAAAVAEVKKAVRPEDGLWVI